MLSGPIIIYINGNRGPESSGTPPSPMVGWGPRRGPRAPGPHGPLGPCALGPMGPMGPMGPWADGTHGPHWPHGWYTQGYGIPGYIPGIPRYTISIPTTDVTTKGGGFLFEKWSKSSKSQFLSPKCRETLLFRCLMDFFNFFLIFRRTTKIFSFFEKKSIFRPPTPPSTVH